MSVRGLAPYAAAAVLVTVASTVAVFNTVRPQNTLGSAPPSAAPVATPARGGNELSKSARLAYWRDRRLWVSNLDGSLRYAIASTEDLRRISLTRWSVDGSAVAFVDSGLSLSVASVDGGRVDVDLPIELRNAGYRVSDIRWSPGARRVAATLMRPGDGRSDAFLVDLAASRPAWSRLTTLEDLFVGDWISNDELLAYTAAGVVGVLGAREPNSMRLISGVQGVSPVIGPEGRIHFLVGRLPLTRDPSLAYVSANRAAVWSAATDGSDARRESTWELNDVRLDARLPDGRYLVHRGSSNAQGLATEDVDLLPANAGVIERIRIGPDGRTAYGFTPERIVRVDLTKLAVPPDPVPAGAVTVFLDTSGGDADVWFPSTLSLARGGARAPATPAARSVFALGSHIWQLEAGVATLLRPAPVLRRTIVPAPRWSPAGEHVLVVEQAGPTASSTTFVAYAVARTGEATRLTASIGASRSYAWSPTGSEVAIVVDRRGVSGIASDAQLEARFFDASGRATRSAVPATEVAWSKAGILVLSAQGASAIQRLEGESGLKTLVTRERLVADAREPARATSASLSALDVSPDGSFASVRLQTQDSTTTRSYFVVLGADGAPVQYVRGENVSDVAWAPTGAHLAYTADVRTAAERAIVALPSTLQPVATQEGRFAGWSPDGEWYFVTRTTGLYAYRLGGGAPVRVGPGGAPLSAATVR